MNLLNINKVFILKECASPTAFNIKVLKHDGFIMKVSIEPYRNNELERQISAGIIYSFSLIYVKTSSVSVIL